LNALDFEKGGALSINRRAKVLLIHQYLLIGEALKRLLDSETDFELVALCGDIIHAQEALHEQTIDVAILNLNPNDTVELCSLWAIRDGGFNGPIVILTDHLEFSHLCEVIAAGVSGIVLNQSPPSLLSQCIREVLSGGTWIDQAHVRDFIQGNSTEPNQIPQRLTGRERDVLAAVLEGLSTKVIAYELGISESGVKSALQQLFRKTGVKTRSQLVRLGIERYRAQLKLSRRFSRSATI